MADKAARIAQNLESVRKRIAEACNQSGRGTESVSLIAVTKYVGLEEVRILYDLGVTEFGENRVQEARAKIEALGDGPRWHMVGNVQRRKAKDVVALFSTVDAVDRVELAEALQKRCDEAGRTMPVLLEVNISGEASKHGFRPDDLEAAVEAIRAMPALDVQGLMTMAPHFDDPELTRPVFAGLRQWADRLELPERSMGMTNDYMVAIEEGATQIRIGSALFEGT